MKARISQSELDVMDVLWDASEALLATDIHRRLSGRKSWSLRTVKTLLGRLTGKGVISHRPDGRRFLYSPEISREDYARAATGSLADRLFGGRVAPLVAQMAESRGLSPEDVAELEILIREYRHD